MKRIPYLYILLLPYIIVLGFDLIGFGSLIGLGIFFATACVIAVISVVLGNIASVAAISFKEASLWNLVIKLLHLPAHYGCICFFYGTLNPWMFMASWVPIALSICLQGFSSALNIGACINGLRNRRLKLLVAVLLALLSYVYVIDIIAALVQLVLSVKKPKKKREH